MNEKIRLENVVGEKKIEMEIVFCKCFWLNTLSHLITFCSEEKISLSHFITIKENVRVS
jgi:hypothetical protein